MNTEVRPRYYNKGSEFGKMHRWLGKEYGMTDIDNLDTSAVIRYYKEYAEIRVEPKNEDELFYECSPMLQTYEPVFKAIYDIKFRDSDMVRESMKCKIGTSTWIQYEASRRLGCRFYIVIATDGMQPFHYYEYKDRNNYVFVGTLNYIDDHDGPQAARYFYKNILKL